MARIKLSIVVQPLSPLPGLPSSGKGEIKFLEFSDSNVSIAKFWRSIEERYRKNYLEQAQQPTFAIKKIQDEDGNDIDITFTLQDIFEDTPAGKPKILNVIPTRIDRDVSIPVTSDLRPKSAHIRPPVPLFKAPPVNAYANLNPDRPIGSTERDLADEDNGRRDQQEADDREGDDEDQDAEEQGLEFPGRVDGTRRDIMEETSGDEQDESHSNPKHNHEADDERCALPRNDVLAAADRAYAAGSTNVPPVSTFAKPILPASGTGAAHRIAQLRDAAGPLQHNSRLVRKAPLSRPASNNTSTAWPYDSRSPYDLPDSDLHGGSVYRAMSKNQQGPHQDHVFQSGGSSRTSTDSIMSSHPAAMLTPPTSNDGAPLQGILRINVAEGPANASSAALPSDRVNGHGSLRVHQMSQVDPSTSTGILSRVQARPTNSSQPTGLGVPSNVQGTKLRSPFQPHLDQANSAAPSSSFDDPGESPILDLSKDTPAQRVDSQALHHRRMPSLTRSDVNEAVDDVEDSMHEDVVRRTASRRKEAGLKRRSRDKLSALELATRSGTSPSPPQSRAQSVAPQSGRALQSSKFITPVTSRQDRSATVPPPRNAPMVPTSRNGIKSTPAQHVQHTPPIPSVLSHDANGRSSSAKPQNTHDTAGGRASHKPTVKVTPTQGTDAEPPARDGNAVSPEWPRDYSYNSEILQNLSTQAIQDVENERAMASTAAGNDDAMDVTPNTVTPQQRGVVKRLVSSAEARVNAEVRQARDQHTRSWLKAQQDNNNFRLDAAAVNTSSMTMSQGREAARQRNEAEDTDLRRKKPDPKGKRRAVPSLEDQELLKSAGVLTSDERMDIDNDHDAHALEMSPSSARQSVYADLDVPFAVVIEVPHKGSSRSPAQSSRLVESTPSQEVPTSAQPERRTVASIPASAPSTQQKTRLEACADCRRRHQRCVHMLNAQPSALEETRPSSPLPELHQATEASSTNPGSRTSQVNKKTPSKEFFAFLPEKPGPDPPKRKRKDPASSPPDNLASELRKLSPPQKKRKVGKIGGASNPKNVICSVALGGGHLCQRQLTCKTHTLSQKRAVPGRDAPLDQLLAQLKDKAQSTRSQSSVGSSVNAPIVVPSDAETGRILPKKTATHRRASTVAPEPIELMSDADLPQKQALSPSRSRRAATVLPESSPRRRSITSRMSLVAGQDPIVVEPSDAEVEARALQSPSRNREAASATANQSRQRSSHLSDVIMLDGAADSVSSSFNGTQAKNDASHLPAAIDDMDIDVGDNALEAGSAPHMESQTPSPSLSVLRELDAGLQSSAKSGHSQEQRGKYNVLATKPLLAPPMSFPTQSSQPSQPSQTSTTRSPESSPERLSDHANSQTPLPPYKQRSSSPDWVTPQWVRDKEERAERRRLESASQAGPTLTPSRTPRLSVHDDAFLPSSMPPPPVPAPKIPQTPLKSILKRNSSSSTSASQPVRRVSIDPAVEQFPNDFRSATQPATTTSAKSVPTMSSIMARPERSPSKTNNYSAQEASPLMSDHTMQDTKARISAMQLEANGALDDDEDDISEDGDVEDNEVDGSDSEDDEDESASSLDDKMHSPDQVEQVNGNVGSHESDEEHQGDGPVAKSTHAPNLTRDGTMQEQGKDDSESSACDDEVNGASIKPSPNEVRFTAQGAQKYSADSNADSETESDDERPATRVSPRRAATVSPAKTGKAPASPVKSPAKTPSSPAKSPTKTAKTPTTRSKSPDKPTETTASQAKTSRAAREQFVLPPYESQFLIPLGPKPPQPVAPRFRWTAASSQPVTSASTKNTSNKAASASSPLRGTARAKNDASSDDDTSSDSDECEYSHESDNPEEIEAEVSRRIAGSTKVKINSERNLVKWYLRQDRVEQRRRDKEAAKEKAKLDKYMQTVFGNATTDPWAAEREEREAKAKLIGRRRKSDNYD